MACIYKVIEETMQPTCLQWTSSYHWLIKMRESFFPVKGTVKEEKLAMSEKYCEKWKTPNCFPHDCYFGILQNADDWLLKDVTINIPLLLLFVGKYKDSAVQWPQRKSSYFAESLRNVKYLFFSYLSFEGEFLRNKILSNVIFNIKVIHSAFFFVILEA